MTSSPLIERLEEIKSNNVPRCSDFDADCDEIPDHLHCWLYDPAKGYCPFLRAKATSND